MLRLSIKKIFTNYSFTISLFVLALASRLAVQLYFFSYGTDRSLQMVAAKNFRDGHGISLNLVMITDLSKEIYQPLIGWPPGYSIFVGVISFFLNNNIVLSAIVFDLLSVALFLYYSRKVLQILNTPVQLLNFYTLISGFFLYDFLQVSTSDLNAVAFFVWTFYMSLDFIKNDKKGIGYAAAIGLINFISPFIRYMFIPVAVVIPFYLVYIGNKTRDKRIYKGGLMASTVTIVLLVLLFFFQNQYTGSPLFINSTGKGFFPANLLEAYPVIFASFINLGFYYSVGASFGVIKYGQYAELILGLNVLLLGFLLYLFIKFFFKKRISELRIADHFIFIGGTASAFILCLLTALSLHYAPFVYPTYRWTFIKEARYMAFPLIFIQLLAFVLIFSKWQTAKNNLFKIGSVLLIVVLWLEVLHGMYFTGKILLGNKTFFSYNKDFCKQKDFINQTITGLIKKNLSSVIVFTSTDPTFTSLANLRGAKALYNLPPQTIVSSSRPFILIVAIKEGEQHRFKNLLDNSQTRLIKKIGYLQFYEYRSN